MVDEIVHELWPKEVVVGCAQHCVFVGHAQSLKDGLTGTHELTFPVFGEEVDCREMVK